MIEKIVARAQSNWTKKEGPENHIVISSRVRLARNLAKLSMPPYQKETSGNSVFEKVKKALDHLHTDLKLYRLSEIPPLERQILYEKHLISPEHAIEDPNKALIISPDEAVSIMVNEEDHLRIQVLYPGLQLQEAWERADEIDNLLESQLDFAFSEEKGYLTSCPTNVGTGLRASVMVHIPALFLTKQVTRIFSSLGQLGLVVRGLYGEGTEAKGNLLQISNQITLGEKETEIIQNLIAITKQIVEKEETTRQILLKETPLQLADRVGRAYGILKNAAILSSEEALSLLSDLNLGLDLGLIKMTKEANNLKELIVLAQPGFLQKHAGKPMEPQERDAMRAKLITQKLERKE